MISIRRQLVFFILGVVAVVTLLLIVATNISVREELDELYDENMKQVAMVLVRTGLEDQAMPVATDAGRDHLAGEEEFLIQIWRGGQLQYSSHPAIPFALQNTDGFGNVGFKGRDWRFYRLPSRGDIIQIAQDLPKRHEVVAEIYRVFAVPIIIQLPVLGGLIWFLIGYTLRPLVRLSSLIEKRSASFLEPLPGDTVPLEIRALVDALNDLLVRLKLSLDVQRRFTADAAHELRTPLAAVRLQLDILQRAADAQEKQDALDTLEKGVSRSIRLVQQLLELARQEPDNVMHARGPIAIDAVIRDVAEQAQILARQEGVELATDIAGVLVMQGNAAQLGVMIGNLVNNALLYTPAGGHVRVTAMKHAENIVIDIADDGMGIALKDRERVFDRFYRGAGTDAVGSGLGLSIVKSIAQAHGIALAVTEGLGGKGTCFRLVAKGLEKPFP